MEKPKASSFLSENKFWEIISAVNVDVYSYEKVSQLLIEELNKITEKEIIGFLYNYSVLSNSIYNDKLWAAAYIVMGGCSDDCFDYFRDWIIIRGRTVYYKALNNPDSIYMEYDKIEEGDIPYFENYAVKEVFEERFGKDINYEEENCDFENAFNREDIQISWSEYDESLKKICPKTFNRWWNNERF